MTEAHDAGHEQMLESAMFENEPTSSPELQALLSECASCRTIWEENLEAQRVLRATFAEQKADEDLAGELARDSGKTAPGEVLIHDTLRRLQRDEARQQPTAPIRKHLPLLAAAGLILGLLLWRGLTPDQPQIPVSLGDPEVFLEPNGSVKEFQRFAWNATLPADGWFEIHIKAADGSAVILKSERLHTMSWQPTENQLADLPDSIVWELRTYRARGLEKAQQCMARRIP